MTWIVKPKVKVNKIKTQVGKLYPQFRNSIQYLYLDSIELAYIDGNNDKRFHSLL